MLHTRLLISLACSWVLGLATGCAKSTANDGDDPAGGETDDACEIEFEDAAPGTSGSFTVRNDRTVPIYIPQSISACTFEAWQLLDGDTPVYWNDAYVPTCTEVI